MPAVYSSQPISGFTGHIPGSKWQVGSRYIAPVKVETKPNLWVSCWKLNKVKTKFQYPASVIPVLERTSGPKEEVLEDKSFQNGETMQLIEEPNEAIERSIEKQQDASEQPIKEYHNSQQENGPQYFFHLDTVFRIRAPRLRILIIAFWGFKEFYGIPNSGITPQRRSMASTTRTSRRAVNETKSAQFAKKFIIERRELVNRGRTVTAGEFSQTIKSPKQKRWQNNAVNDNDIPAVGYSGHMPGLFPFLHNVDEV
uniref:Uncharacterized protein n=1 Tax=Heterorhabditis bacteriophora TaxID=37862 RepID=A0A1I7X5Z8_HETBA